MRRVVVVLAAVLAAGVLGFGVVAVLPGSPLFGSGAPSPNASPPARTATPSAAPEVAIAQSYQDAAYDARLSPQPSGRKPQSKLWYHDGSWWGVLLDAATNEYHIHLLDWDTQLWVDTGTLVDERPFARADALWDGAHLYIDTGSTKLEAASHATRVIRFSYDAAARRYNLDPNFPVVMTPAGAEALTIAKDTTGALWAGYIDQNGVQVNHTVGGDFSWGKPFKPPVGRTDATPDTAALASHGTSVGFMWTNEDEDVVYFASHADGQPDQEWTLSQTEVAGLQYDEDHLDMKALAATEGASDGGAPQLFAVIKASADEAPVRDALDPQIVLLSLQPDGTLAQSLVGRVEDRQTRPILILDSKERLVYVLATVSLGVPEGGTVPESAIYYTQATVDDLTFPGGPGQPFITSDTEGTISDATSTKQNVTSQTGMVVLASDDTAGRYVHGALALGGELPGSNVAARPEPDAPQPETPPSDFIYDTFDPYAVGGAPRGGWALSDPALGSLTVVAAPSQTDRSARVVNARPEAGARACKNFGPITTGRVTFVADALVSAPGASDALVAMVRGGGSELASARFGDDGQLYYFSGTTKVPTGAFFQPGQWYRATLTLDLAGKNYDLEVGLPGAAPAFRARGAAWRTAEPTQLDKFCFETPRGVPGLIVQFDNVRIRR